MHRSVFVRLLILFAGLSPGLPAVAAIELQAIEAITDQGIQAEHPAGRSTQTLTLNFALAPGEYEPTSFVVSANGASGKLEFRTTALLDGEGQALAGADIDIRYVKRWYQKNFGGYASPDYRYLMSELLVYDDELIRAEDGRNYLRLQGDEYTDISEPDNLRKYIVPTAKEFPVRDADDLQPLQLADNERRQLWVTLFVPEGSVAGLYTAAIEVLEDGEVIARIPLLADVLPIDLAEPLLDYSIYYRGFLDDKRPDGSPSSEVKSRAQMLADLKNFKAHGVSNPLIYQKFQTGKLRDVLELRAEAGLETRRIFYLGVNIVDNPSGKVGKRLGHEVRETLKITDDFDIGEVYFFARDEARGEKLSYQFPFWEEVKNNGGRVFAAGWQETRKFPGNFNTTDGREDVFVSLGVLQREEAARWHGKGKRIYSYMNPKGGNELPLTWRRNYGLLLWQHDYDGSMPYAWQHSYGSGWNDFDHYRHRDHNFTYPTVAGPIDTIAWEGFREGVDDVRYLSTLLELLESKAGDANAREAAAAWVSWLKDAPLAQLDLNFVRAQAAGHILALQGYEGALEKDTPSGLAADFSVIEPGGQADIDVRSFERSQKQIRVRSAGKEIVYPGIPAMRRDRIRVQGLVPGRNAELQAEELEAGAESLTIPVTTTPESSADVQVLAASATGRNLSVQITGPWRASIAVDADRSLLGWWRFSGKGDAVKDLSSWGHDGELKGSAKRVPGWFGQGVSLDGEGAFVSFPDIEIPENGSATIEGWFRFREMARTGISNRGLFSGFYQHGETNNLYFNRTNEHFEVSSQLWPDTWHHIVLTWDGDASTAKIYVDGVYAQINILKDVENVPAIDGLTVGRSAGYLGGLVSSARNTFAGDIDEIRVWNRPLSYSEVLASFRGGPGTLAIDVQAPSGGSWKVVGANAADREFAEPVR